MINLSIRVVQEETSLKQNKYATTKHLKLNSKISQIKF